MISKEKIIKYLNDLEKESFDEIMKDHKSSYLYGLHNGIYGNVHNLIILIERGDFDV